MCVYCFGEIVILPFSLFPQSGHIWSAMQCAVTHRKEKEHKNFPPVLGSQDNVHSKQHLGSLLRALRCALFLSSCTCSKNVIFQGKGTREKGSEASAFCCSCTLSPALKASCSWKVLYMYTGVHTATAHLHLLPALLPVTTAGQRYDFTNISLFTFPPILLWQNIF